MFHGEVKLLYQCSFEACRYKKATDTVHHLEIRLQNMTATLISDPLSKLVI